MNPETPRSYRDVVAGVELQWSVRGTGSNVVVLHGLSDSERSWWPVMADIGAGHRVVGLDLPGCGESGRPDASYSLDWQARVVIEWLDRIGISTCDIVGHSYGGGVAMWMLLHRANLIRRMALVAPGGLGPEVAPELRLAALPFVVERLGQPWMGAVAKLLLASSGRMLPAEERERLCGFITAPGSARAFGRTVRDVIDWRGQTRHLLTRAADAKALPAIRLFWGDADRIIPITHGERLCKTVENISLERFEGAGHFLHWERPHELAGALADFFDAPWFAPAKLKAG